MHLPRPLLTIIAAVAVAIGAFGTMAALAQPAPAHPFFAPVAQQSHTEIIAHRGGAGLWPENTLYAFEHAAAMGIDMLEMDVRSSADDVLVLMHDSSVERTTNGMGAVRKLTFAELQALDAAYHWSDDGGQTYRYRDKGITVPTIADVFSALPEARMNIEMKTVQPSLATTLCALIQEHKVTERVLVASFNHLALQQFRAMCPGVATSASEDEARAFFALNLAFLGPIYSPEFYALQVPEQRNGMRVLTPGFVRAAHDRGLEVHAWTINEENNMKRMSELGMDGIVTDYPDRLRNALGRN
ncbi:MAG TPA: glycerophosphodiester phosphodiesterase [Anaerolineales bacterium]|jgi:glycerophosphoryl diester phosphodiesterase|nr:glycerophosphodiester phosphodiesterase [Anaerolineales bacterium]